MSFSLSSRDARGEQKFPMEQFVWEITEEQKKESQDNFFALTNGDSSLSAELVRDNFVNILPATDLFEIWYPFKPLINLMCFLTYRTLSDLDVDGALNEKGNGKTRSYLHF